MAIGKQEALRTINRVVSAILRYPCTHCCKFAQQELKEELDYYFSNERITTYSLVEYSNGFYFGELNNGNRVGYGVYYWHEDDALYLGEWSNGNRTGTGFMVRPNHLYYGGFLNGDYHGERSLLLSDGVEIEADFSHNDVVRNRKSSSGYTTPTGKSFSQDENSSDSSKYGCCGLIFMGLIIYFLFKMCS